MEYQVWDYTQEYKRAYSCVRCGESESCCLGLKLIIEEIHFGRVAHSGERRTCNAEAAGAEPVSSTIRC